MRRLSIRNRDNRDVDLGLSRRRFLMGLGAGTGLALTPWLPMMSASGQEQRLPKRLLLFYTPDGIATGTDWKPTGSATEFTFSETHQALEPHKADIVLPYGLRFSSEGAGEQHAYGMAGLFTGALTHPPHEGADFDGGNGNRTGWGSGPSVDQVVAMASGETTPYRLGVDESAETLFRTLEVGALSGDPNIVSRMIYRGDKQPIHPENNPVALFDRVFGGPVGLTPEQLAQLRLEKRSALDLLSSEIEQLKPRLSSEELPKLEAHLEGLRSIERRLDADVLAGCVEPERPSDADRWYDRQENFPQIAQTAIDLTVRALACDATRVASIQLSRGFSSIRHTWVGVDTAHHELSHSTDENLIIERSVDQWYSTQFAYLLEQLKSIPEAGGTMLDNTLVLWGRELGYSSHNMRDAPLFLAGSAQGALQTGRFLDFTDRPHSALLVSVCQAMGLDVSSFGNVDPDSGPLSGLVG